MDKIRPVTKKIHLKQFIIPYIALVSKSYQVISLSVYNGFIHNDLHTGNIKKI